MWRAAMMIASVGLINFQLAAGQISRVCGGGDDLVVGEAEDEVLRVWPSLQASPTILHDTPYYRLLQINWEADEVEEGDWLGVFDKDPRSIPLPPLDRRSNESIPSQQLPRPLYQAKPYASLGSIITNLTQPRIQVEVLVRGGCVGPFVGYVRAGVAVAAECVASHPDWLHQHREVLGSRSLRSLVLPGTHDSGSYTTKDGNEVLSGWFACQDEDILSQLLYGNRYLDLRVGYYPNTQELLWVNHDLVRWRPFREVLEGVESFLAVSSDPLILDIHRTPVGFHLPKAMPLLLSVVNAALGPHLLPSSYSPNVTLSQIWQEDKRIIFTLDDDSAASQHEWVWPPLPQAWVNAHLRDDLRYDMDQQMLARSSDPRIWAAMVELTPTIWDVILRPYLGVRGLADRVNFSATRWLRLRWANMANIIATDYFRGNNIINVAIRTNLALSFCGRQAMGNIQQQHLSVRDSGVWTMSDGVTQDGHPKTSPQPHVTASPLHNDIKTLRSPGTSEGISHNATWHKSTTSTHTSESSGPSDHISEQWDQRINSLVASVAPIEFTHNNAIVKQPISEPREHNTITGYLTSL